MVVRISQHACRVANRIALGLRYAETSGHRTEARQIVQEVLSSTCELLDQIDAIEFKNWFEQFELIYSNLHSELDDDPVAWAKFLGGQCDLLHAVGLHQKTIACVGDELANWNRAPIEFSVFANSLDGLASLVSDHAMVLGDAIEFQAGKDAKNKRRTELFSNAVFGLTTVLISIDEAIKSGDPRGRDNAAMAMFGASLTNTSVMPIFVACNLSWV